MSLRIQNNAMNQAKRHEAVKQSAAARLASGKQVNRASEGAAELAAASQLTSAARSVAAATSNARRALSFGQIADGALAQIQDEVMRIKELAVAASSDTFDAGDRAKAQAEVTKRLATIDFISDTTRFGDTALLKSFGLGDGDSLVARAGYDVSQYDLSSVMVSVFGGVSGDVTDAAAQGTGGNSTINGTDFVRITIGGTAYDAVSAGTTIEATGANNISGADGPLYIKFQDAAGENGFVIKLSDASQADALTMDGIAADMQTIFNTTGGGTTTIQAKNFEFQVAEKAGDFDTLNIVTTHSGALSISAVSVNTISDAQAAIGLSDTAIGLLNDRRAAVGAFMAGMDSIISTNEVKHENIDGAVEVLMSADVAKEATALAMADIRSQLAQSMVSKENQAAQNVTSLVR